MCHMNKMVIYCIAYQIECEEKGRGWPTYDIPWFMPGRERQVNYRAPCYNGSERQLCVRRGSLVTLYATVSYAHRNCSWFYSFPPRKCQTTCTFIFEGLLKHFPRFSSSFPAFQAEFYTHTHTHVVLPSPSFSLPKKIASRSLHLFTSVAVIPLLVVIEWCSKKRCVTNGCRYSAPLAAVRSVHWFRRCVLSPVFYWSYLVVHWNRPQLT
jgi:hypothetical protein